MTSRKASGDAARRLAEPLEALLLRGIGLRRRGRLRAGRYDEERKGREDRNEECFARFAHFAFDRSLVMTRETVV